MCRAIAQPAVGARGRARSPIGIWPRANAPPAKNFERAEREREELNRIGVALSATHDVGALLQMILAKTREITGADAGSLYVVETAPRKTARRKAERRLRFKLTQNDSRQFLLPSTPLPMNEDSLAGYAALHGEVIALDDAYAVPAGSPVPLQPRDDQRDRLPHALLARPCR